MSLLKMKLDKKWPSSEEIAKTIFESLNDKSNEVVDGVSKKTDKILKTA